MKEDCDTDDNIEIPTNNTDVVNLAMIVLYCTINKYTEDKYVQYGNIGSCEVNQIWHDGRHKMQSGYSAAGINMDLCF